MSNVATTGKGMSNKQRTVWKKIQKRWQLYLLLLIPLIYIIPQIFRADQTTAVYMAEPVADLIAVTFTAILFSVRFKKALREI